MGAVSAENNTNIQISDDTHSSTYTTESTTSYDNDEQRYSFDSVNLTKNSDKTDNLQSNKLSKVYVSSKTGNDSK